MRRFLILFTLIVLATSVHARQVDYAVSGDVNSVVIKSVHLQAEPPQLLEPVLNHANATLKQQYNFDDSQIGSPTSAFFSSLFVPGSGQITHKKWWRAGIFMALEATGIYLAVSNRNSAVNGERSYEQFIDNNWSVVEYSNWLINYHEVNGINNPYINDLKAKN